MSWFADLAGKAENLLNNLDEQTGAALRNHVVKSKKHNQNLHPDQSYTPKIRSPLRSLKKNSTANDMKFNNFVPARKLPPTSHSQPRPTPKNVVEINRSPTTRSPVRKPPSAHFSLNQCPKTLVGDFADCEMIEGHFGLKQRRSSLPADLELQNTHDLIYKMQNLEVVNAMLKNELNVMNREVSELLDRLRRTEDGKFVVNGTCKELSKTQMKLENSELQKDRYGMDADSKSAQLEELKQKINDLTSMEILKQKEISESLETDICMLRKRNEDLEEKLKELNMKITENNSTQIKTETELRHAQSVIGELQANLDKSTSECRRMEKDWEAYKHRVKAMLHAKDKEIKSLQEGAFVPDDAKTVMEDLEKLKEEREELSQAVSRVREECEDMKQYIEQLETKHAGAERVVTALRDALREERGARNKAEAHSLALGKELKTLQLESGQTIASLRSSLRDKESEVANLRSSISTRTIDTSALNVADYDATPTIDNERLQYLTETLVQKQGKIDLLMADNNMLRIQLDKLDLKYKREVQASRNGHNHVVQLQESERRARTSPAGLPARLVLMVNRHPLFRTFLVIYMICLHLWVLAVLFTSTPDGHLARQVKL